MLYNIYINLNEEGEIYDGEFEVNRYKDLGATCLSYSRFGKACGRTGT